MAVVVRKATGDDAGKIAEFSVALAEQHYGYDQLRFSRLITTDGAAAYYGSRIEAESAAVLVAEIDGRLVGFAYMEYEPVLYAELATKVAWLHDIYVEPDAQGSGAGRELLDAIQSEARKKGAEKVLLSVAEKNDNSQRFFEKYGFRQTMREMMLAIEKE
jgi:ribosomal protein S18 acetylase RimI-like enzyme